MEILMDYHLMFIVIAFVLLILTIIFLFIDPTREKAIGAMLLAGINYLLALINSLSFFGIGLVGYTSEGESVVTALHDMQSFALIFMLFVFVNAGLIFYAYWVLVREPWTSEIKEPTEYKI